MQLVFLTTIFLFCLSSSTTNTTIPVTNPIQNNNASIEKIYNETSNETYYGIEYYYYNDTNVSIGDDVISFRKHGKKHDKHKKKKGHKKHHKNDYDYPDYYDYICEYDQYNSYNKQNATYELETGNINENQNEDYTHTHTTQHPDALKNDETAHQDQNDLNSLNSDFVDEDYKSDSGNMGYGGYEQQQLHLRCYCLKVATHDRKKPLDRKKFSHCMKKEYDKQYQAFNADTSPAIYNNHHTGFNLVAILAIIFGVIILIISILLGSKHIYKTCRLKGYENLDGKKSKVMTHNVSNI